MRPNDDLKAIQRLYRRAFGLRRSRRFLAEKYRDSIGFIAYCDGLPAAHYGIFKWPLAGLNYNSYQSADTMTDPDHQGRGLFLFLARLTYEEARRRDVDFVFGFPNENSYPGFVKLGWEWIGEMYRFEQPVRSIPVCELAYRNRAVNFVYSAYLRMFKSIFGAGNYDLIFRMNNHLLLNFTAGLDYVKRIAPFLLCSKIVCITSHNKTGAMKPVCKIGYLPINTTFNDDYIWSFSDIDTYWY